MAESGFTFGDLIAWSEKLLPWQRDALRRILNGRLTATDIEDLAAMAKAQCGLSIPGKPSPMPATEAHVRASGASTPPVALISVRDITYVNALGPGPVGFAPEGLTVIYGDNASGKSGIARILKKAGRAREPGGAIRPNVFGPDPGQPASAVIDFRVGTVDRSASWTDGSSTDAELTKVNIFDAGSAAVQVEADNRLAYTPQILQVFQDLAEGCRAVGGLLRAQQDALEKTRSPQLDQVALRSHTKAGVLAASLSAKTTHKEIDDVCEMTAEERARHQALMRALQDNPLGQSDLLGARARSLRGLDALTASLENMVSDTALQQSERLFADAAAADEAARVASEAFASGSALAGLGSEAWKKLWESARKYSETFAYPGEAFPVTREEAICLLCQQPLERVSAQRLTRFEQFVQEDVQQTAETARGRVETRKLQLEGMKLPLSGIQQRDAALRGTPEGQSLKAFIVNAKLRRRFLLRLLAGRAPDRPRGLPSRPDFTALRESISEEIARLRAAAQAEERKRMQSEFEDLDDRLKLAPLQNILKNETARLIYAALLDQARADCDTTWITRKGGDVAEVVVTARLRSDFAGNLNRLGFAGAPVEIKLGVGAVGQHPYRLSLIAREDVPPSEVLSEGEKTCVALAGFLAELEAMNNGSGIILDDPVSSLDHQYRLRVARLLVEAAKHRQVVVFTHDVVFLLLLTRYAHMASVPLTERSLRRGYLQHGLVEEGPPWVAMSVSRRIGVLRNELQAAGAALRKGDRSAYEQKAEWIYDRLRQSWERAVEELLLNQVVVRFGVDVQTHRLKLLTDITDADVGTVESEMAYCSSFVHDESGAVNAGIPEPAVVGADIKKLDDWVVSLRKRGRK